jgi:phosphotransferase family enzyme
VISFWERVERPVPVAPAVAGRTLRRLHEALEDYRLPLAAFAHPAEALRRLAGLPESPDHELLRGALTLPTADGQALHGDAAVNNCVGDGRWIDFDLAARGPREADVATIVMRDAVHGRHGESSGALAGYGPCDHELLHVYLRGFVALTCVLLLEQNQPSFAQLLAERLAWLRATR